METPAIYMTKAAAKHHKCDEERIGAIVNDETGRIMLVDIGSRRYYRNRIMSDTPRTDADLKANIDALQTAFCSPDFAPRT